MSGLAALSAARRSGFRMHVTGVCVGPLWLCSSWHRALCRPNPAKRPELHSGGVGSRETGVETHVRSQERTAVSSCGFPGLR